VQVGFRVRDSYGYVAPGWYVDEVELRTGPEIFNNPESFEVGWGDWFSDGALWQIRRPGNGPVNAHTGTNAACGNIGGNYPAGVSSRLISPILSVPALGPESVLLLRFWQWYQYGAGDTGAVQVTRWNGLGWEEWSTLLLAATNGTSTNWQQVFLDLSAYQGQKVRLGFLHSANGDGSVGAGWFIDDLELSSFAPTPLTLGHATTNRFDNNGQYQFFVLRAPSGGHLRLTLQDLDRLGVNELYLRRSALPSPGNYDYRFKVNGAADQTLLAPDAGAGQWYALAYNASGPVPGDYILQAELFYGVALESVTPSVLGNSVPGTLTIEGAGFTPDARVDLVRGTDVHPASDVGVVSSSRILADFEFSGMAPGTYALRVWSGTNSSELPFTLTPGGEPGLGTRLIVPSRVGYHAVATLWVEYANTGQVAMLAPLIEVGATQNGRAGAWLTLTDHRLVEGFWTSATPEGFAHSVQFLASGATPGLLQPGESGRVPVYYAGWQQPWDMGYPPISFRLVILDATNTNLVNWAALKDSMRPNGLTAEQWEPVFWSLVVQTGPTWGEYVKMLSQNARYLAKLGITVVDIRELLGFKVTQARGLSVEPMLVSAVDAQVQTPSLSLNFTRSFGVDIPSRFCLGRFGRGWSDNWDYSRSTNTDGTVIILGPNRSRRVFQPDSRHAGRYFPPAGDSATLTPGTNGVFTLSESDGTRYVFRSDGKLDYLADTHNNRITCGYSGIRLEILQFTDAQGRSGPFLTLGYNGGYVETITDSFNRQTRFTYDGEHLRTVTDYQGRTTIYAYVAGQGAAREHALAYVLHPDQTESHYAYDSFGRLITKAGCCGSPECTHYAYDSAGRITATDALTHSTKYWFDHRGLLVRTEDPLSNIVHRTFDSEGRLVKTTDPAGRSRTFNYDARGNLISETDALGYTTRYTYTADFNRLATVTDARGNMTRYAYEPDGDLASITYADGSHEDWTYDSQGNRVSWTNRRRQTIYYTNDVLGRLIARRYPDGVVHTFNYDAQGNLASYTDPIGTTTQEFDATGRLAKITYPHDRWLGYTYDAAGRRASMTNELGYATYYHYDAQGRLQRLTDERGSNIVVYAYDAAGRMAIKTLGNGVFTTYTYDSAGQLLDLFNHKPDGSVLSRFQYSYDSRGRRGTMTTTYGAADPRTDLAGLWRYDYDDTGQLIGWTAPWGRRVDYTYDALGNRLNVRDDGTNTAYSVNKLNQYTEVGNTTYQYDADGNLTNEVAAGQLATYLWSFDNKLTSIVSTGNTWQNFYDAFGNRCRTESNGLVKCYVIDPSGLGDLVGEYDNNGTILSEYVYGAGLLVQRNGSGNEDFFSFDALGSTSELAADSGAVLNMYSYLPFGEQFLAQQAIGNPFQFIAESGVVALSRHINYMRARHYQSYLGRFISTDPVGISSGDINLYRYVINAPVSYTDPSGLQQGCDPNNSLVQEQMRYCARKRGKWLCYYRSNGRCVVCFCQDEWPDKPPPPDLCQQDPEICDDYCFLYPDHCKNGRPVYPGDPNKLIGPSGHGTQNFVAPGCLLPYSIHFENETNAKAPAQRVVVSDRLTNLLDSSTFELTEIAFGDHFITVPPHTQHFETSKQLSVNGYQFVVEIEAGIHVDTGEVYARFQSLNPTNGLPPPVDIGFLPPEPPHNPNDTPPVPGQGRGQGHISYVIRANTNLVTTGTEIRNVAYITFDQNPPIGTDWVDPHDPSKGIDTNKQALVTIDADLPTSTVLPLTANVSSARFEVCWAGSDVGAGVSGYDVYVQTNGGPWLLWLNNTPLTCAEFPGQNNVHYGFYSVARDFTGQIEPAPTVADTATTTPNNSPPELAPVPDYVISVNQTLLVTNVATDPDLPVQSLAFSLDEAPAGATINPQTGLFHWTPQCAQGSTSNRVTVRVTDDGSPVRLSDTTTFWVSVYECVEASLGRTVVLAGQSNCIPMYLLSTVELTNLSFRVVYPANRFTNLGVHVNTQQVPIPLTTNLAAGDFLLSFTLPEDRILHGPTNVGDFCFSTLANQSSAFVPLVVTNLVGRKPSGTVVANAFGYPGRVVVIGRQPLLEAFLSTNGEPMLVLYGNPGTNYVVEYRTTLQSGAPWAEYARVTLTNLSVTLPARQTAAPLVVYRACEATAGRPSLHVSDSVGPVYSFILFGKAGSQYVIQTATNLGPTVWWSSMKTLTLTNSMQSFDWTNQGERARYFRAFGP
jgi:RHS repeat-associated protein